jgi:hypothetical protein
MPEESTRRVSCHCCGARFYTDKPQDPALEAGFGTCGACSATVAASWVKHGFPGCPVQNRDRPDQVRTLADAVARLETFA